MVEKKEFPGEGVIYCNWNSSRNSLEEPGLGL
jgi:hypothetical protein